MLRHPYQELKNLSVVAYLYAASTEKMSARILAQDPEILAMIESLRGDSMATASLLREAKEAVERPAHPNALDPDEMVLIAALFVLARVAPGSARLLRDSILAQPRPPLAWTRRFATWLLPRQGHVQVIEAKGIALHRDEAPEAERVLASRDRGAADAGEYYIVAADGESRVVLSHGSKSEQVHPRALWKTSIWA